MATFTQRIIIANERSSFTTLWLEPWGEDYGMAPGASFEVVAAGAEERFYFHVAYGEKRVQVYAEGAAAEVSIYESGKLLSCGHDRREETW